MVDGEMYLPRPKEAPIIYEVLGFDIPDSLKMLMTINPARLFIPADDFPLYAAGRIFIVCSSIHGAKETYARIIGIGFRKMSNG
ncbi:hypothetical protein [Bacillus sp. FJAT-26390]|uniref:hypothetical protein n=1 Tax=Bacillus sp. FJAT-26390 TaxID=1743142 RepID=UPI000807DCC7|nr:hypothetical protein [Bacillus sp. FJAT-26390]OBZ11022.1 hypothetical protein A7975_18750 [Bacillus sp. FJAT-26390]